MDLKNVTVGNVGKPYQNNYKYYWRIQMRKTVITTLATVLAFENTMKAFDELTALAYNMKQTKTRMTKEQISARIMKHKEMIKTRKDKIKLMEKKKKINAMKPEKVQLISQRITKQQERIAKHNEALKYYKMLSQIKPPKLKVNPSNPAKRNEYTL
jgi:hypothetical protein